MRLAASHPTTYYGQRAGEALSLAPGFPDGEPEVAAGDRERFEARPPVRAARMLGEAGDFETLRIFVSWLSRGARTPGEHLLASRPGLDYGAPHLAVDAAKRALRNGAPLIPEAYPLTFGTEATARIDDPPDHALLLAIARQESGMDPRATSRSGAMGLTQLLPDTARAVSGRLGMDYSRSRLLDDPQYNIVLGSAYLSELLERYEGDRVLALAAYNAGPSRVGEWLRIYGDPRDGAVDPIDWIELVPYAETRSYIQRVLESAAVYRYRLNRSAEPSDSRSSAVRTAAVR